MPYLAGAGMRNVLVGAVLALHGLGASGSGEPGSETAWLVMRDWLKCRFSGLESGLSMPFRFV